VESKIWDRKDRTKPRGARLEIGQNMEKKKKKKVKTNEWGGGTGLARKKKVEKTLPLSKRREGKKKVQRRGI